MEVFNSGKGGIKCDRCSILIKGIPIIRVSKKGKKLHYCCDDCLIKHNAKERENESTTIY